MDAMQEDMRDMEMEMRDMEMEDDQEVYEPEVPQISQQPRRASPIMRALTGRM